MPSVTRSVATVVAVCLTGVASGLLAQPATAGTRAEYTIKSAKLGETRTIYVVPPYDYADNDSRHAVVVLLDAGDGPQFAAAIANTEFLANRGEIPSLIIVGLPNGRDRTHDLTPRPSRRVARDNPTAGGAAATASFITDEVLPLVRSKYRTLPTTILAGHSFGGLFAVHVAATTPEAFSGIIAMSPSLWWNEFTAASAYADSIARVKTPLRLFATSGGLEPDVDSSTRRFVARLDSIKPAALALAYKRYPDDTHAMTPAASLVDGIRFIFAPLSLGRAPVLAIRKGDSTSVVNAFVATQRSYARAAHDLRMPESLPEPFVNTVGYAVLRELRLPRVAAWVFRENVSAYPNSPNAYDSLGDALLAAGNRQGARAEFQRAIDVATRNKLTVDSATRRKLKEVSSR
ncbi:MAG TPA: alpha/beta hydrolase-fold protein [Gemmatimonadaceae bacterium]|nr:alpha/beta hydrolase-fold protein [Gemmatimonadaceae bacterium]